MCSDTLKITYHKHQVNEWEGDKKNVKQAVKPIWERSPTIQLTASLFYAPWRRSVLPLMASDDWLLFITCVEGYPEDNL